MHGYESGTVEPTTELVLGHKHPDDKAAVAALIDNVIRHGHTFSSRHRIIDVSGQTHVVVVVSDRLVDDSDQVIGTAGFYIDITDAYESDVQDRVTEVVEDVAESRAPIEQARGILMFVYNISAQHALDVLKWRSQAANTSLGDLSAQFVHDITSRDITSADMRGEVDHVLLTVHERVARTG